MNPPGEISGEREHGGSLTGRSLPAEIVRVNENALQNDDEARWQIIAKQELQRVRTEHAAQPLPPVMPITEG